MWNSHRRCFVSPVYPPVVCSSIFEGSFIYPKCIPLPDRHHLSYFSLYYVLIKINVHFHTVWVSPFSNSPLQPAIEPEAFSEESYGILKNKICLSVLARPSNFNRINVAVKKLQQNAFLRETPKNPKII